MWGRTQDGKRTLEGGNEQKGLKPVVFTFSRNGVLAFLLLE